MTTRRTLTVLMVLLLAPAAGWAERKDPLEGQPSIRKKVEMRKLRFEVTPGLAVSINQDFRTFIGGSLALQFHFNDWIGLGVQVAGGGGIDSKLTSTIDDVLNTHAGNEGPNHQPSTDQFNNHLASTKLLMSLYLAITPFAGKLSLFGAAVWRYDLYALAGVGGMLLGNNFGTDPHNDASTQRDCANGAQADLNFCDPQNDGFKIAGMFGAGVHVYFNDWLGLNLEVRDYLASVNWGGYDVNGDSKLLADDQSLQNNLFFGIGLTFMLPPTAKVSP